MTTNSVGYTKYSHTAPDNINMVDGTSFKRTRKQNIRMANREAGLEMNATGSVSCPVALNRLLLSLLRRHGRSGGGGILNTGITTSL